MTSVIYQLQQKQILQTDCLPVISELLALINSID